MEQVALAAIGLLTLILAAMARGGHLLAVRLIGKNKEDSGIIGDGIRALDKHTVALERLDRNVENLGARHDKTNQILEQILEAAQEKTHG